jgi:hypothetical protein
MNNQLIPLALDNEPPSLSSMAFTYVRWRQDFENLLKNTPRPLDLRELLKDLPKGMLEHVPEDVQIASLLALFPSDIASRMFEASPKAIAELCTILPRTHLTSALRGMETGALTALLKKVREKVGKEKEEDLKVGIEHMKKFEEATVLNPAASEAGQIGLDDKEEEAAVSDSGHVELNDQEQEAAQLIGWQELAQLCIYFARLIPEAPVNWQQLGIFSTSFAAMCEEDVTTDDHGSTHSGE